MLLGRDHEQQALVRLLDDARTGASGVLAIVGEAGIGKSTLLAYAGEQAAGMNVLRARGVQSEAHIPFAGLFELLRPALSLIRQIPTPQSEALESALALRPASAPGRFAVGAATLSLLAAYSEKAPVAVLVDDTQWLDGSSADALLFAFRRLVADPVAVVLAVRQGEMPRPTPPGSAGSASVPWRCWTRPIDTLPLRNWPSRSSTSAATSPGGAG
jgi:predicted ATPase